MHTYKHIHTYSYMWVQYICKHLCGYITASKCSIDFFLHCGSVQFPCMSPSKAWWCCPARDGCWLHSGCEAPAWSSFAKNQRDGRSADGRWDLWARSGSAQSHAIVFPALQRQGFLNKMLLLFTRYFCQKPCGLEPRRLEKLHKMRRVNTGMTCRLSLQPTLCEKRVSLLMERSYQRRIWLIWWRLQTPLSMQKPQRKAKNFNLMFQCCRWGVQNLPRLQCRPWPLLKPVPLRALLKPVPWGPCWSQCSEAVWSASKSRCCCGDPCSTCCSRCGHEGAKCWRATR